MFFSNMTGYILTSLRMIEWHHKWLTFFFEVNSDVFCFGSVVFFWLLHFYFFLQSKMYHCFHCFCFIFELDCSLQGFSYSPGKFETIQKVNRVRASILSPSNDFLTNVCLYVAWHGLKVKKINWTIQNFRNTMNETTNQRRTRKNIFRKTVQNEPINQRYQNRVHWKPRQPLVKKSPKQLSITYKIPLKKR